MPVQRHRELGRAFAQSSQNRCLVGAFQNRLGIFAATQQPGGCQQVDRLQKIGLALRIGSGKHVESGRQDNPLLRVVSVVPQGNFLQHEDFPRTLFKHKGFGVFQHGFL